MATPLFDTYVPLTNAYGDIGAVGIRPDEDDLVHDAVGRYFDTAILHGIGRVAREAATGRLGILLSCEPDEDKPVDPALLAEFTARTGFDTSSHRWPAPAAGDPFWCAICFVPLEHAEKAADAFEDLLDLVAPARRAATAPST